MPQTVKISDLEALRTFAAEFAAELKGGEIIGLVGDLGAGKTTFVQLLATAFGVEKPVRSPTFILMQIIDLPPAAGRLPHRLCHVDAYRLKDERELMTIGFEEYAGAPGTVTLVEWADRVPGIRQMPGYREIIFRFGEGQSRELEIG